MTSLLDRFRLDGRVAVVTGSGQGIGRGIALGLADAGADLVVNARRKQDLAETAEQIRARGRRVCVVCGDLRGAACPELARVAVDELGRLDIWVNNVGGSDEKTTRELVVTGTPYVVAYRVTPAGVQILRVVHGARDWPSV